jgi:four helix bundle protein
MDRESLRTFEDLECWKACQELRIFVARTLCKSLPKDERYRLGDQILRAARSTTANIAEGYGRFHFLDNAKFCSNARGSCWETIDHMITAADEDLISEDLLKQGRTIAAKAIALLNGYISYLRKAAASKPPHEGGSPQ